MVVWVLTEGRHPMHIVVAFFVVFFTALSVWILAEESR
jgi:hypothetical protein